MRTLSGKTYRPIGQTPLAKLSFAELRGFIREERRLAVKVASTLAATLLTGAALFALAAETAGTAKADTITTTTSSVNSATFGMTLPQAALPTGQDEIHSSDGTSCRSAVGGNGAYMDMGVIGAPQSSDSTTATAAAYGRVVIPLGQTAKRLDCTQLYALQIERLKMELQLARMGNAGGGITPESRSGAWMEEGWNDAPAKKDAKTAPDTMTASASPTPKSKVAGAPLTAEATPSPATVVNDFPPPPKKDGKKGAKTATAVTDPLVTGSAAPAPAVASSLVVPPTVNLLPPQLPKLSSQTQKVNWMSATQAAGAAPAQPIIAGFNALY